MEDRLQSVTELVNNSIRPEFECIWAEVTDQPVPEYRILVWGSVAQDKPSPRDLDLIFEYSTNDSISPDKEKSIEGWLRDNVSLSEYSYLDPMVVHYLETPTIIADSRMSRVYSVDESGWVEFD